MTARGDRLVIDDPHGNATPDQREAALKWFRDAIIARESGAVFVGLQPRRPPQWPADISVPPPVMRGRIVVPTPGEGEGDFCLRDTPGLPTCLKRLELMPADRHGGCTCFINGPCAHCMSIVPECPAGCYRGEEP